MESTPKNFTFNIFEKAKSFFHHLRWIFCLSSPDESNNNLKKINKLTKSIKKKTKNSEGFDGLKGGLNVIFNDLPEDCLIHIFSHLSIQQKGVASQVCADWNSVLKYHPLWADIDLTLFKVTCQCKQLPSLHPKPADPCSNPLCYNSYKTKIKQFLNFILKYQFRVTSLKLCFDIIDCDDNWDVFVQSMWKNLNLMELRILDFDWLQTAEKAARSRMGWGAQVNDLKLLQRRRTRRFEFIFRLILTSSPHLETLRIPFEWTNTCVQLLCQMKTLKSLSLTKCSNKFSSPSPSHLDSILKSLSRLQHLEVFIDHNPHALHHSPWSLRSESLKSFRLTSDHSYPTFKQVHLPHCSEISFDVLQTEK